MFLKVKFNFISPFLYNTNYHFLFLYLTSEGGGIKYIYIPDKTEKKEPAVTLQLVVAYKTLLDRSSHHHPKEKNKYTLIISPIKLTSTCLWYYNIKIYLFKIFWKLESLFLQNTSKTLFHSK